MQNFTFGRKGLNWFLFAFILFVGSASSYGQCYSIEPDQNYCYLETIQDLIDDGVTDSDGDTAIFETADSENDTDPIDEDELLTDGETYFVGSTSDDSCTRVSVTVSVDDSTPTPMNTITNDRGNFTISPCESSDYTAGQLEGLFTPDAGFRIEVYDTEFGTTPMGDAEPLTTDGSNFGSYFVGQVDDDGTDGVDECPSTRAAVGFDPIDAPSPTVDDPIQTFCEGDTVADLMASGTEPNTQAIRWYRSMTSSTPLDDDEELIDGEDYFAGQVVNDRNSPFPPCETPMNERTEVIAQVNSFDAGDDVTGEICEDDLRQRIADGEGANILYSFVTDGRDPFPSQVSFDPSLGTLAQQFENSATELFTTATFTTPEGCTDDIDFTITVNESYNAGDSNTEGNVVCRAFFTEPAATEAEVEAYLRSLFNDAEGAEIDSDGNFSNDDITTITDLINDGSEGPFTTTYTVGEEEPCEDTATFTFEVDQADDLGTQTGDGIYCQSFIDSRIAGTTMYEELARELFLEQLDSGVPQDGDFENLTLSQVVSAYSSGIREFMTTYSITTENGCTDSVDISFEILEDLNAGDDNLTDNSACRSDFSATATEEEIENFLFTLLSDDADTDGEFSNLNTIATDITNGDNGPFNSTYTTGAGFECSDFADFQFSVIDDVPANAGNFVDPAPLCETDDPINLFTLDNTDSDAMETGTFTGEGVTDNVFDPSAVTSGETYTITYTVSADPENCITGPESFTTFDITVDEAPISTNITRELCVTQARELISDESAGYTYILGILTESGVEDFDINNFDPAPFAEAANLANFIETPNSDSETFNFTYNTPSENSCDDGEINIAITINNTEDAFAGEFSSPKFLCIGDEPKDLNEYLAGTGATPGGTFSGEGVSGDFFDPATGVFSYTITYSVDATADCVTPNSSDEATFTIEVLEGRELGPKIERRVCVADVPDDLTAEDIENYLASLIGDNYSSNGIFNPLPADILIDYNDNPIGFFETEYTLGTGDCEDSVEISIEVFEEEAANAGDIGNDTLCSDQGLKNLSDYLIGSGATPGGTFTGEGVSDNMFDTSIGSNADGYTITYTVDDTTSECVLDGTSDTIDFTIFVEDSFTISAKTNREEICKDNITNLFPSSSAQTTVRNFYLNMLEDDVPTDGQFNPTIRQLINRYNTVTKLGDFTTKYTVTIGECSSSVDLTIEITDTEPAVIGDITDPDPICRNAEDVDLFSFLPADANPNGTFEGYDNGVFSPSMEGAGTFTITYSLSDDSPCTEGTATADFTITVTESAYAGMDLPVPDACTNDTEVDLNGSISADADAGGVFTLDSTGEVIADGILDISGLATDTYTITYTVAEINDCGDDDATLTLTVSEAPAGPTVDGDPFTFCASNAPTGADLSATGSNLTFYSDAELSTMIMAEDALTTGTYYVTQRADDGGCESNATEFSVTVNDADTPTISDSTLEFCDFDDPTVDDLSAEINETGTITWYDSADGDNALAEGTPLQDGTIYYAALFDADSGCESSVRLAVTALVENCPVVIPEGFSPNGDQLNDTFDIKFIEEVYPNYTIVIHNRYGDVVYRGNANTPNWDGFSSESSFGDNLLPVGAYFYYLDYNDGSTEPVRGTVYLSR